MHQLRDAGYRFENNYMVTPIMSESYEYCRETIDELGEQARRWGEVVDKLIEEFARLSPDQGEVLRKQTSPRTRFNILNQYLHFFRSDFCQLDDIAKMNGLKDLLVLIILDGFSFDYRETLRILFTFFEVMHGELKPSDLEAQWRELRPLANEETTRHMERFA